MGEPSLGGTLPVLATPFTRADAVDLPSLRRLADYAVAAGRRRRGVSGRRQRGRHLEPRRACRCARRGLRGHRRQGAGDRRRQRARRRGGGKAGAGRRGTRRSRGNGHGPRRGGKRGRRPDALLLGCDQAHVPPAGASERTASSRRRPARRHRPRGRIGGAGNPLRQGGDAALRPADHGVAELARPHTSTASSAARAGATSWTSSAAAHGGTMPAVELTEAHAAVVRAHRANDMATARRIYLPHPAAARLPGGVPHAHDEGGAEAARADRDRGACARRFRSWTGRIGRSSRPCSRRSGIC